VVRAGGEPLTRDRLGSPRVRLFVALELPKEAVDAMAEWAQQALAPVDALRLVRRESLHATLVFLGYQYERDIERIAEVSLGAGSETFELTPAEVVPVPRSRPRLFALDLEDGAGGLGVWQGELSERLHAARLYEPEHRPFWPHVTMARVKRGARVPRGLELPALPPALHEPFTAFRVTLFKSTLRPSGAVYEALATTDVE